VTLSELVVRGLVTLYTWLTQILRAILETTLFKAEPELAERFSDAFTIMVTLTAIYLILTFFGGLKKIIKIILLLGWFLLIAALIIAKVS